MEIENENRKEIDVAIDLFKFLPAKDIFESFYSRRLVRRVLFN